MLRNVDALMMDADQLDRIVKRLKRIEGQARGLQRLLVEGRGCDEIITQLSAMRAALNKVALTIVTENLEACLAMRPDEGRDEAIERARQNFLRLM